MVGCRLPLDKWTDPAIPECKETRQLMEHDNWHFNLGELFEREEVVKETGCKVPCSYVKYELANQVNYELRNETYFYREFHIDSPKVFAYCS